MTEPLGPQTRPAGTAATAADGRSTAGAMLRAARDAQGVHIAMLAAAIKVSPRKLDALENDRYAELPDATFTRALAQTVCRALKIDAAPVLARLPQAGPATPLEQVSAGLNTPFHEKPGRTEVSSGLPPMPLVWGGVVLLAAAGVILLWPAGDIGWGSGAGPASSNLAAVEPGSGAAASGPAVTVAALPSTATAPTAAPVVVETVHAAPPAETAGPTAAASGPTDGRGATLSAVEASWVEIVDASGQTLLSRVVQPGETVRVDGALPMRVRIGNARATQLAFRGQPVGLEAFTRDNVARVELK